MEADEGTTAQTGRHRTIAHSDTEGSAQLYSVSLLMIWPTSAGTSMRDSILQSVIASRYTGIVLHYENNRAPYDVRKSILTWKNLFSVLAIWLHLKKIILWHDRLIYSPANLAVSVMSCCDYHSRILLSCIDTGDSNLVPYAKIIKVKIFIHCDCRVRYIPNISNPDILWWN